MALSCILLISLASCLTSTVCPGCVLTVKLMLTGDADGTERTLCEDASVAAVGTDGPLDMLAVAGMFAVAADTPLPAAACAASMAALTVDAAAV